jgi:hypothetical protein
MILKVTTRPLDEPDAAHAAREGQEALEVWFWALFKISMLCIGVSTKDL